MALQHTYRRTLTISPAEAMQILLDGAPTVKDCTVVEGGNPMRIHRKRNMLANRWAMDATVAADGQLLTITVDGNGSNQAKFAEELLNLLPAGAIDDHGLERAQQAMARSERFFSAFELSGLLDELRDGEEVLQLASGQVDGRTGLIVVTTKRILTKDKGAFESASREILPKHVTSISTEKKLTGESVELTVSGEKVKFTTLQPGRSGQIAEHVRRTRDAYDSSGAASDKSTPGVQDIAQLAELHAAGILTDEEFKAAKARALGL